MPELRTGCNQSSPRDTINELPGVLRSVGGISQAITNPPGSDAGSNQKIPGSTEAGGNHRAAAKHGEMMKITFTIPGKPTGKGRPRFARRGAFVATYTDSKTASYENLVKLAASQAMGGREPLAGAVSLSVYVYVMPPASWSKKKRESALAGEIRPTVKPDSSNVLKSIEDGMNHVVYLDDKQIVLTLVSKSYAAKECAHVEVIAL